MAVNDHTVRVVGQYQGIFAEVATAVNAVQDRVNYVADTVEMVSHGDLTRLDHYRQLGKRSEQDRLVPAFIRTLETLQILVADTDLLTRAARKGQLGARADATKHEGEYRKIVEGVNETLDTVVVPFKKVQGAIVQLESSTQDTSKSSDEIAKAAEQVAVTSQKCADLSKKVLEQIENIEGQIADLSASNEEIAGTAQEVLGATNEAVRTGRESLELGEATKKKMAVVEKISRQSMDEIVRLNGQMAEIGKIVKLINDIANQTNLLALNAAIEAARAGEHGRGFAVVAGEIRNLAGESKKASHNIEDLITSILANSNQTAKNMEQVYLEIESGVESVNDTIAELKKIVSGAEMVSGDMAEIARAIEGQANVANRVVQAMDEGTRLTKETQAQVEDLASLSEETSASTEEIGSAAHELNSMARDLKETMQRFSF
jgi:methyl-accepting chemotaxis protein